MNIMFLKNFFDPGSRNGWKNSISCFKSSISCFKNIFSNEHPLVPSYPKISQIRWKMKKWWPKTSRSPLKQPPLMWGLRWSWPAGYCQSEFKCISDNNYCHRTWMEDSRLARSGMGGCVRGGAAAVHHGWWVVKRGRWKNSRRRLWCLRGRVTGSPWASLSFLPGLRPPGLPLHAGEWVGGHEWGAGKQSYRYLDYFASKQYCSAVKDFF